ncbi:MAG: carboxypeptidase-like regulatory domain-containing protein [Bacteroidota bacterium]|nr:carboxypeptidase-like regulatory domain-containing protein [Bacteroidota bacterium]
MFRYLSVAIYCILLLCWSQQTDANDLLTNATTNGILIDQQLEQNNEQNRYVISGFVVDIESAESLVGATVYASEMGIGTTTNRYGFFSLSVAADSVRLVVSHVGYLTLTLNQTLTEDLQLNIELQPEATRLDEVEVVAVGESSVEAIQMSQIKLPVATIRHFLFWQEKQTYLKRYSYFLEFSPGEKELQACTFAGAVLTRIWSCWTESRCTTLIICMVFLVCLTVMRLKT